MAQTREFLQVTEGYITEPVMSEPKRRGRFPVFHSYGGSELAPNGNQAGERLTDIAGAVPVPLTWCRSVRPLPPFFPSVLSRGSCNCPDSDKL